VGDVVDGVLLDHAFAIRRDLGARHLRRFGLSLQGVVRA
jgi:hypothetical protein